MTRIISVNLLMDSQLTRLSNRKKKKTTSPLNDSCDSRPYFLASATSLVTEASERSAQAPLFSRALSESVAPMR